MNWVWYRKRVSRVDVESSSWMFLTFGRSKLIADNKDSGYDRNLSCARPFQAVWQIACCTACAVVHPDLLWKENCSQHWKAWHDLLMCIGYFWVPDLSNKNGGCANLTMSLRKMMIKHGILGEPHSQTNPFRHLNTHACVLVCVCTWCHLWLWQVWSTTSPSFPGVLRHKAAGLKFHFLISKLYSKMHRLCQSQEFQRPRVANLMPQSLRRNHIP